MEAIDRLLLYVEELELMVVFSLFLAVIGLSIIFYLIYLLNSQRKENQIKRNILRKRFGCIVEDFYEDVI